LRRVLPSAEVEEEEEEDEKSELSYSAYCFVV
jgi:hypothetical protein